MALVAQADSPTSALNVAGMLLFEGERQGLRDFTARKLQKLLYFTQLYHLGFYHRLAFRESLKAWEEGPVVPEVRHEYKAGRPQDAPITVDDIADQAAIEKAILQKPSIYDTVKKVVSDFGRLDQQELIDLTHGQKPWMNAWMKTQKNPVEDNGYPKSEPLSFNDMESFARTLLGHTRPTEIEERQPSIRTKIAELYQASGDLQFVRAKMYLAESAALLDYTLARTFGSEEIEISRSKFAAATKAFGEKYGEARLGIDTDNPRELDEFALAMTDFGMAHRTR